MRRVFLLQSPHAFAILPALHGRVESSETVRGAFEEFRPDATVVEIPSSLETLWRRAVGRLPAVSAIVHGTSDGGTVYLPVHPADPLAEASRLAATFACGDLDVDGYGDYRDPVPDPYAVTRLGLEAVYRAFQRAPRQRDALDDRREASLAYHAQRLHREGAERVLVVCGMHHAEGVLRALEREQAVPLTITQRTQARLLHVHPESLAEVLPEPPFTVAVYEVMRDGIPAEPTAGVAPAGRDHGPFRVLSGGRGDEPQRVRDAVARAARAAAREAGAIDRLRLQWALVREAEQALAAAAPDETTHAWQRRNLARFSRNLARMSGMLVADLFDLLVAARGCVSDNFAWELHRLATSYPHQEEQVPNIPTARIRAEDLWEGTRRIQLSRHMRRPKSRGLESLLGRKRRDEAFPGEWLAGFDDDAVCSYPPEDVVIEDFGRYLKRRGTTVLSEERAHSVPFTTSLLDGIDLRETLRHWGEGTLWVRQLGRLPGEVGPVVVIFDEDTDPRVERFPFRMTWLGEHEQESDMAFYSTDPTQAVVGPGICRVTYGGLLLSFPPRRLMDVWTDPDYRFAETKSEVLLLAALDYSTERIVVHVAAKAPRSILHTLAARLDRRILHVPIGTLSPTTLRRIRVMHILGGHATREVAKDYLW